MKTENEIHVRRYLAMSIIKLDAAIHDAPQLFNSSESGTEFDDIRREDLLKDLKSVLSNQVNALCAAFGESHTVPSQP